MSCVWCVCKALGLSSKAKIWPQSANKKGKGKGKGKRGEEVGQGGARRGRARKRRKEKERKEKRKKKKTKPKPCSEICIRHSCQTSNSNTSIYLETRTFFVSRVFFIPKMTIKSFQTRFLNLERGRNNCPLRLAL